MVFAFVMWVGASVAADAEALLLVPRGGATGPAGVVFEWRFFEDQLAMKVANHAAATLTIDWDASVLVDGEGRSVGLAPGSGLLMDALGSHPPMVVPSGSMGVEAVLREDRIDPSGRTYEEPFFYVEEAGATVRLDLGLKLNGASARYRRSFKVEVNPEWTMQQAYDARRAAEAEEEARKEREARAAAAEVERRELAEIAAKARAIEEARLAELARLAAAKHAADVEEYRVNCAANRAALLQSSRRNRGTSVALFVVGPLVGAGLVGASVLTGGLPSDAAPEARVRSLYLGIGGIGIAAGGVFVGAKTWGEARTDATNAADLTCDQYR